jgi:hypothetical protein
MKINIIKDKQNQQILKGKAPLVKRTCGASPNV